jgi:cellulose synthase/poly-beta-1,6-N-acetylglucosamine synthase-like glycosyltransferase
MIMSPDLPFIVFAIIAGVQIFYYSRYFSLMTFYKKSPSGLHMESPVSVIICARDEADQIEQNLPGVLVQKYKSSHQVVVVNDNSIDDTKYFLEALYRDFKQLHIVELKQEAMHIPGKKFPLSMGIKSAKYEIILLTDADCIPSSENWIQLMQDAFTPGIEIVLGYGAFKKRNGFLNGLVRFDAFHSAIQYFSYALAGQPYMGVGRNLAYKKELFYKQKGFASHHHLAGGDDDLFINASTTSTNTAVVLDKEAFTLSTPPDNWREWIRQKRRHNSTGRYYKFKDRVKLGIYMLSHFLFYPLLITSFFTFNWQFVIIVFSLRLVIQGIVFFKCMKKLDESDLFPYYLLWDIWMFFYYLIFISSLWKKPMKNWS